MIFDIKNIHLPSSSGIYLMKDDDNNIIYIGKAKNLKNRVRSYFTKNQNYKTRKLVQKISDIEFVLTDTEDEAFLLESNMIKRYRPAYNIELKDQQRYTYLRVTDEKYPRLLVARRMRTGKFLGKGDVYGPFTHGSSKLLTIGTLRKTFKIRICKTLPKKVCLEYHLGNCEGPCEFKTAQVQYDANVEKLESILKGKKKMQEFVDDLKRQMDIASESLEFERAKEIRDTLYRLDSLGNKQKMEYVENAPDEDYIGIKTENHTAYVMSLQQKHGVIKDRERFVFDLIADNTFSNFLYQYYTTHKIPKFIIVSELPQNKEFLEKILSKKAKNIVQILSPTRGKRYQLIQLVIKNIELVQNSALLELQEKLGLLKLPKIIECFDISNHGEEFAVGSMSRFVDGSPDKQGYRKFKIKTVKGRDDYAMISEVVKRRYLRLAEDDTILPDLILIDGGKGQLGSAVSALKYVGVDIPCVSLAKKHEEIFLVNKKESIKISAERESLKILQYARDEAHRFGVGYNRALRKIKKEKNV